MADLATRFPENPILKPADVPPSIEGLRVECVLNPGAFRFNGKTWLLLRVAEAAHERPGKVAVPVRHPERGIEVFEIDRDDPDLDLTDPRIFSLRNQTFLSTLSHLRLASSDDGVHFNVEPQPALLGEGPLESYGVEDCRVTALDGQYLLTYTAVSPCGIGIGLRITEDWRTFTSHGMIISPDNKDGAIFEQKVDGAYYMFHRPANKHLRGNYIWMACSQDLQHWGNHRCVALSRPEMWDSERVGAGAAPIWTPDGWLEIYHGANATHRYCLGALLLDLDEPWRVIARSEEPIMEPREDYERKGFFGEVIFTNGHVTDGDTLTIYYGASDSVVCGATFSIREILDSLR